MSVKNILFVMADQFRADLLFGEGGLAEAVDLPNLRALMAEGTSFDNYWTVTCPCGPARASILTGQYAMNHRSARNGTPLDRHIPTLPREIRKAGFAPMLFGYTDTSGDPRGRDARDPALRSYEMPMEGFEEKLEMRLDTSFPWRGYLAMRGYDLPPYARFYEPQGDELDSPAFYAAEDSDTAFLTDECLKTLAGMVGERWFAHLTYIRPHPPFVAPAPWNRMFAGRDIPAPLPGSKPGAAHPVLQEMRAQAPLRRFVQGRPDLSDTPEAVRLVRQVYLGLAAEVDHHLGRIIAFLKKTGQYDETLIVFASDHGEMLGDYGLWGKASIFDAAYRVPLIIRDPSGAGAGRIVSQPTESVDLLPTLLDYVGLDCPTSVDGCALRPLIEGAPAADWRDHTFSELEYGDIPMTSRGRIGESLSLEQCNLAILREEDLTLVHFNGGLPPLLFDRRAGGEAQDHAADPAYAGALLRLTRKMLDHRMTHANGTLARWAITADGPLRV